MQDLWSGWKVDGDYIYPPQCETGIHRNMLSNMDYMIYVQQRIGWLAANKPTYATSDTVVHVEFDQETMQLKRC